MSKYLITDGINYLKEYKQGDYYLVDKNDATSWNTYKQALNAMNNGVRKDHRDMFYVEKSGEVNAPLKILKKLIEADTSDFNRWLSSIGNFKQFVFVTDQHAHTFLNDISLSKMRVALNTRRAARFIVLLSCIDKIYYR